MTPITEIDLAASLRQLFDRMDFLAVVTDQQGQINYANKSLLDLVGRQIDEVRGKHWISEFTDQQQASSLEQCGIDFSEPNFSVHHVFSVLDKIGEKRIIDWNIVQSTTATGLNYWVFTGVDITEKVNYERALTSSLAKLSDAQRIAKVGDWDWTLASNNLEWSEEVFRIFGRDPFSFTPSYQDFMDSVYPDDLADVQAHHLRAQDEKKSFSLDHRIILPDNSIKYVHCETELKFNAENEIIAMVGTVQDVSELREKELELNKSRELLRRYAQAHDNIREQECKRIAREVHDELGQQLTALRLDIALSANQFGAANTELFARLSDMKRAVDTTIQTVRSIASSLRPAPLDMGLQSAIDWLVEQLQMRNGLDVQMDLADIPKHLPEEQANSLFRIIQESLTNVARHANARNVAILFAKSEEQLIIQVNDDGCGFEPEKVRHHSAGLLGIRERATLMNGLARIQSAPGAGTNIEITLPITTNKVEQCDY